MLERVWRRRNLQPLWRIVWRFPEKLKIQLPYDPAIPLLGIYPKELKTGSPRDIYIPMFTAPLFTIVKRWKQTKYLSTDGHINKMRWVCCRKESGAQEDGQALGTSVTCGFLALRIEKNSRSNHSKVKESLFREETLWVWAISEGKRGPRQSGWSVFMHASILSCSVMSHSLGPHGL